VVPVSRWPVQSSSSSASARPTTSPVRVVPLYRWPFADPASGTSSLGGGQLAMDGLVVDRAGTAAARNEYVETPSAVSAQADLASSGGRRRRVGRKTAGATTATAAAMPAAPSPRAEVPQGEVTESPRRRGRDGGGLAGKMRRLLSCVGASTTSGSNSSSADEGGRDGAGAMPRRAGGSDVDALPRCVGGSDRGTVCRRCGRCRCRDCAAAEQSSALRRARSLVDVVSCMCCVRSLFYHCLKDDAGDELDCSDEPCACTERPHCALRWVVMAAVLPCLPCLCLYVPLRCGVDAACRHRSSSMRSCRCSARSSRHPGLKGLLDSESSST